MERQLIHKTIGWIVVVLGILDLLWTMPAFVPFSKTLTSLSGKKQFMLALLVPVLLIICGVYCLRTAKGNSKEKEESSM